MSAASIAILTVGVLGAGIFLHLLVDLSKTQKPGPGSTTAWGRVLFEIVLLTGILAAAFAIKDGWS